MSKNGAGGGASPARRTPPRQVLLACSAIALSALAAVIASLTLLTGTIGQATPVAKQDDCKVTGGSGVKGWLYKGLCNTENKANNKATKSKKLTTQQFLDHIHGQIGQAQKGLLISTIVFGLVLALVAWAAYRGRYWARWGVLGVWFVATLTGTIYGISSLLSVGSDVPAAYKAPSFLAALFLLAAVILTNLRPSAEYFALSRPAPRPGQPARRGLFAPRPAAGGAAAGGPSRDRGASKTSSGNSPTKDFATTAPVDRSRTKKRANNAAVAKGAELARTRAKAASKSRRTDG